MKAPDYELRAHDEPETRTEDMGHGFQTTEFENPAVLMTRRCRPGPSKLTDPRVSEGGTCGPPGQISLRFTEIH